MGPLLPILCDGHLALLCVPWLREVCPTQWKIDLRGSSELTNVQGPLPRAQTLGYIWLSEQKFNRTSGKMLHTPQPRAEDRIIIHSF